LRVTGRLTSSMPWTVTVADSLGTQLATGGGLGTRVDWTWDARLAPPGRYIWAIRGGPTLRPATGVATGGAGVALTLSSLVASPPVVSPNGDGFADSTTIRYTLGAPATVTATLLDAEGVALGTLFTEAKPAGVQSFRWLADALPDGTYTILLAAKTLDGREVTASVPVSVNRTLSFVSSLPSYLSPNADGRADRLRVAFTQRCSPAATRPGPASSTGTASWRACRSRTAGTGSSWRLHRRPAGHPSTPSWSSTRSRRFWGSCRRGSGSRP
jgi:hypothetical protein